MRHDVVLQIAAFAAVAAVGTAHAQTPPAAAPPAAALPAAVPLPPPPPTTQQIEAVRKACDTQQAGCNPLVLMGSYERAEVEQVLADGHYTIEPAPWGKTLRRIIVEPQEVFSDDDYPLTLLNIFHRTTRRYVLEREVILRPGEPWRQSAVDETIRKLHDRTTLGIAVAVPVVSDEAGTVDLLLVTRDVWSIRLNSNYQVQSGKLTFLTLSLSENNFLGWRKLLAAVFTMDQGAYAIGPEYVDRNVQGRKLTLIVQGGVIFGRDRSDYEGSTSGIELSRPLWSLDDHWGVGVVWTHRFDYARSFLGTSLRTYDDPATPAVETIPWEFREKTFSLTTSAVRQWPGWIEQQLRFGHILALQRPSVVSDALFPSPAVEQHFVDAVLPRSERSSQLFVSYSIFTPRYRAFHNIDTYELAEDTQLGPSATVTVGAAFHWIGSENNFAPLTTSAGWTESYGGDGEVHADVGSQHRWDAGGVIDDYFTASGRLVSPSFSIGRVIVAGDLGTRWDETQNRFLTAGGDTGLRGFIIGQFMGRRRAVGHVELRTRSTKLWFMRAGAVAFTDFGGAGETFRSMPYNADVGVGLRVVIPQTGPLPLLFDWAFAVNGDRAGWPGRIILGYGQGF
jgi:hypothetical protein